MTQASLHVLVTNDDGPPDARFSPYIENFVQELDSATDWTVSIAVPHTQRSWIGKAHIIGTDVSARFLYTARGQEPVVADAARPQLRASHREWLLLNGTPATCANIGVNHLYQERGPVGLVVSGPNFGRNTSAAYITSSGTVGAALEAAMCGRRAIALSYSYTQLVSPEEWVTCASRIAVKLIRHLAANWDPRVQVYSINIPVSAELSLDTPAHMTEILENQWGEIYRPAEPGPDGGLEFRWAPQYDVCDATVRRGPPTSDAYRVLSGEISISAIRSVFRGVETHHPAELNLRHLDD